MAKEKRKKIYADKGIFKIVGSRDYFIDYWIGKKRRQEKVGPSLAVARKLLIQRKAEIQEGRWSDPRGERILFKDFSEEFISLHAEGMKSAGRYILSVKRLCRTFGEMELGKITRLDVEKFKAARAKEVKGSSVNRDLACLKCSTRRSLGRRRSTILSRASPSSTRTNSSGLSTSRLNKRTTFSRSAGSRRIRTSTRSWLPLFTLE